MRLTPGISQFGNTRMRIHADFSRRAIVTPDAYRWVASPQGGVARVMLDRVGAEKARATSIVRYAPGSYFPSHPHPGGEEILVLSGMFSEADAHYASGWYLRNPPGSQHQPHSDPGALIFVKLWQMPPSESRYVRIDTHNPASWQVRDGREVCPLFSSGYEAVSLQRLTSRAVLPVGADSAELLIVAGELALDGQAYARGSWMRLPVGDAPHIVAGAQGATVYLKTGHLVDAAAHVE